MDDDEGVVIEPPSMAWLLTFADLVSLLITFFVLLFSMKNVNENTWGELVGEMDNIFSRREPVIQTNPAQTQSIEKLDKIQADNLLYIRNILITRFAEDGDLRQLSLTYDDVLDRLKISLPNSVLFGSGAAELKPDGLVVIKKVGDLLRHLDNTIEVAGHSDPYPIVTEEYPSNWELAMMRAINVSAQLNKEGLDGPVPAASFADSRFDEIDVSLPRAERNAQARRVDIVIHGTKDDEKKAAGAP